MTVGILIFLVLAAALIGCHRTGLRRNTTDEVLGGVCSGIAAKTNLQPNLVRVLAVLAVIFTGSLAFWLYILLWITLPKD